jgi:hypothetical protein
MLQHYNSILPRIMPKFIYPNFFTVFFIVLLFLAKISTEQNEVPFEVNIKRSSILMRVRNDKKLKLSIEDLHHSDGTASGTRVVLYVPLDLKTRN